MRYENIELYPHPSAVLLIDGWHNVVPETYCLNETDDCVSFHENADSETMTIVPYEQVLAIKHHDYSSAETTTP
jgi:hypothetical protein